MGKLTDNSSIVVVTLFYIGSYVQDGRTKNVKLKKTDIDKTETETVSVKKVKKIFFR